MDREQFLTAHPTAGPSGVDLRYEPDFAGLRAQIGTMSREARTDPDGRVDPAPVLDWDSFLDISASLAEKGRDLRLLTMVTRAWTQTDGLTGLRAGLEVLARNITEYWDTLHPKLRAAETPTDGARLRATALLQLVNTDDGLLGDLQMGHMLTQVPVIDDVLGGDLALAGLDEATLLTAVFGEAMKWPAAVAEVKADQDARLARLKTGFAALQDPKFGKTDVLPTLLNELQAAKAAAEAVQTAFETAGGFRLTGAAAEALDPARRAENRGLHDSGMSLSPLVTFLSRCATFVAGSLSPAVSNDHAP
ncbi:MAG: type VI secretion system ImpA family N-terminal domain-containing protein, partial [Pseudomonadota bacterium]